MPTSASRHRTNPRAVRHVSRDRRKASASARGYGYRWRQARRQHLTANPLCVVCLESGRAEPATDVDHIVPWRGNLSLFWDPANWQSLCVRCHAQKTRSDQGGAQ